MNSTPPRQAASTDDDPLPVVDENDRQIGIMSRAQVHRLGLCHRAVHVCVMDGAGRLWLQRRSLAKDTFPGWWDLSATGHVDPGESYDQAARRELREELGLDAEPRFIARLPACERTGWEFHALYWLRWTGEIRDFSPDEILEMRPFDLGELKALVALPSADLKLAPSVADALPLLDSLQ